MLLIGVTGPSGAGKGVFSAYLESEKTKVIDADAVYHTVIAPPSECLEELVQFFGNDIISPNGTLDRPVLSKKVFGEENKENLAMLNRITHKFVLRRIEELINEYLFENADVCIIDAPLLIESGLDKLCNFTVSVIADKKTRIERLIERDGIGFEAAQRRVDSQKNDEFYINNSDYTIYNNGNIDELYSEIDKIIAKEGVLH